MHNEEEDHVLVDRAQAVPKHKGARKQDGRERDPEVADIDLEDRQVRKHHADVQHDSQHQLEASHDACTHRYAPCSDRPMAIRGGKAIRG